MRRFVALIIASLVVLGVYSENDKMFIGRVKDRFTQKFLDEVVVSIYKGSELVDQGMTDKDMHIQGGDGGYYYILMIPGDSATYTLRYEKEGYESLEKVVFMKRFKIVEDFRLQTPVYLRPMPTDNKLKGVTVKATKIKFYSKGDTIVYNADVFNLPEGSMLDNLIKSMPGAELKDDGEITVNGRRVDALLLNGEDFFKGKRGLMLENLPAYMVKNLKAYERLSKLEQFMGKKEGEFVLDVNLKKEYSIGWIGNAEVGAGSENRYLARLFGLRFTTASRIGVYANFNNLNDKRKPGEDSQWTPDKMPFGLLSQKSGGIDYLIKPKFTSNKFSGNADLSYTDGDYYSETTRETYMPQGNLYARNRSKFRNHNFTFNTQHKFEIIEEDGLSGARIDPSLNYSRYDSRSNNLSATFNGNPYDYATSVALFDSIQNMTGSNLRRMMLNRYSQETKRKGYDLNTGISGGYTKVVSGIIYNLYGRMHYNNSAYDKNERYDLAYPNSLSGNSQYLDRYIHEKPNRTLGYNIMPKINMKLSGGNFEPFAVIGQTFKKQTLSRYNLETLPGWETGSNHEFGELPSEVEFMKQAIDNNSYDLSQTETFASINPSYDNGIGIKNSSLFYSLSAEVEYRHYRLDYRRGNLNTGDYVYSGVTNHGYVLFNPMLHLQLQWGKKQELSFKYQMNQNAPSMLNLIEVDNTSDPLYTYSGNSHLKKSTTHDMTLHYENVNVAKQTNFSMNAVYSTTANAMAYAYTIDPITGHRNYKMYNINGNYVTYLEGNYSSPLDKKRRVSLNSQTLLKLTHGVDYISDIPAQDPMRNTSNTWWGTERLNLNYKIGKHSIGLKGYVGVAHVTSSRKDFDDYTLCDFNYGLTGVVKLPAGFEVSTDLTMYSRRGYTTSSANTNDLVWNARLAKSFPKCGLTIAVDGFDMLNQLSNTYQTINSQGRTETYYNSLPHYVMAHVIYRFNVQPKKKQAKVSL